MGYDGNGIAGTLRWKDLALDQLLPVDEEKELALKAAEARKMASGTGSHNPGQQQATALAGDQTVDEEEEDDENDENDEVEEVEEEETTDEET